MSRNGFRRCAVLGLLFATSLFGWVDAVSARGDETSLEYPSLQIGGFGDFHFAASDESGSASSSGFREGQFVLHFNSLLSTRISFFGETTLNARESEYQAAIERAQLSYEWSDAIKLSAGRFHTPINWWNVAFHHGQWLQTSVGRPEMTRFGGEFIPVHFDGVLAEGGIPSGKLNLRYSAGLGNGRSLHIHDAGEAGDVNNHRAWFAMLSTRPSGLYDLELGANFYRDKISREDGRTFRESIVSGHVVWSRETPEVITEFARVRHVDDLTGETYSSDAFYVQVAYRLPFWKSRTKPYVRFEDVEMDAADPTFERTSSLERLLAGIRYDFSMLAALKLEGRQDRVENQETVNEIVLQLSFHF